MNEEIVNSLVGLSGFRCIVADPPWQQSMMGQYLKRRKNCAKCLPYPTMTVDQIKALPVGSMAEPDAHLWLWTTNAFLEDGFAVLRAWGFRYLAPIHWVKPSGLGNYFIHRTQTILFGYRKTCRFPARRYAPNVFTTGLPKRHSEKPEEAFKLIEAVSPWPRLELFARRSRPGWTVWGNEVEANEKDKS
jgi:N6-adenosine-specific RNA methylase IME4